MSELGSAGTDVARLVSLIHDTDDAPFIALVRDVAGHEPSDRLLSMCAAFAGCVDGLARSRANEQGFDGDVYLRDFLMSMLDASD